MVTQYQVLFTYSMKECLGQFSGCAVLNQARRVTAAEHLPH